MGHYDDCYEEEDKRILFRTKEQIIDELHQVESKEEMFLIEKLVQNRNKLQTFFDILTRGLG